MRKVDRIFASEFEYNFASIINRDYYVLFFSLITIAAASLIYPIEYYILEWRKKIFTNIIIIAIPIPLISRIIEYILGSNLTVDSIFYLIFSVIWFSIIILNIIVIVIVYILYIQAGRKAAKGTDTMKKSIAIIAGFTIWIIVIFLTSTILDSLEQFYLIS
ncbi:MAG: hypothetical protein ACFFG0_56300 [Candidatus Thorarchaeota archaeon]